MKGLLFVQSNCSLFHIFVDNELFSKYPGTWKYACCFADEVVCMVSFFSNWVMDYIHECNTAAASFSILLNRKKDLACQLHLSKKKKMSPMACGLLFFHA